MIGSPMKGRVDMCSFSERIILYMCAPRDMREPFIGIHCEGQKSYRIEVESGDPMGRSKILC